MEFPNYIQSGNSQTVPNTSQGILDHLIWNHQTKLPTNANAPEGCLPAEIEPEPNKISQRSIPTRCASLILTSNKRGKGHQKDHFWPARLWRGDLGRSPTKQNPEVIRNLNRPDPMQPLNPMALCIRRNPPGIESGT
jgi:hypothetical protein